MEVERSSFGGERMNTERRRGARLPFIASAEVVDAQSGTKMNVRVSELSSHGCYLDTINSLPIGSHIQLKIVTDTETFEAPATVIYAHPNFGMGVAFTEMKPESLAILQKWLASATAAKG